MRNCIVCKQPVATPSVFGYATHRGTVCADCADHEETQALRHIDMTDFEQFMVENVYVSSVGAAQ